MKVEQLPLSLSATQQPTLASVPVGECFSLVGILRAYLRVAPVKSLVRSTMVHEVLTRGDCFVVDLSTGQLTILKYSTPVVLLESRIQIAER